MLKKGILNVLASGRGAGKSAFGDKEGTSAEGRRPSVEDMLAEIADIGAVTVWQYSKEDPYEVEIKCAEGLLKVKASSSNRDFGAAMEEALHSVKALRSRLGED